MLAFDMILNNSDSKKHSSSELGSSNTILELIAQEEERQRETFSLIASENCCSHAIRVAQGSRLTDKYAEGYPGRRYYGGCEFVDQIETLAIEAACRVFECSWANVQPHSGSQANQAVFMAFLNPGDRILGLDLSHGGHLTHGFKSNFSGKTYEAHFYGTDDDHVLNMEHIRQRALEIRPKMIIAGASSYSRIIDWAGFRSIADEVGAYFLADIAHFAGLIVGKAYPSPLPHAHFATFSTHKVIRGPRGGGIVSNHQEFKNAIDRAVFPGCQGGPLMHTIAAKGICFEEANSPEFREYSKNVVQNARNLAKNLASKGWKLVSGGTDCHMFVLDLEGKLSGLEAEKLLAQSGILISRSLVPNDIKKSIEASGIRIGTASITSRGFMDMELLAEIIDDLLTKKADRRDEILRLCAAFPLP